MSYVFCYWNLKKNTKCSHSHPHPYSLRLQVPFFPLSPSHIVSALLYSSIFCVCSAEGSKIDIRYINHGSQSTKICAARNKRARTPRMNCFQPRLQTWFKLMYDFFFFFTLLWMFILWTVWEQKLNLVLKPSIYHMWKMKNLILKNDLSVLNISQHILQNLYRPTNYS